ncbi:MAG: hypothetical protein JOY58_15340 [Solirubrobacterales bacterium]|nr:hypothetical protein [Solirubrobacterales bacterium]
MTLVMRLTFPMLIRRVGEGSWHTPQTTTYTDDAELRDLLAETPSLLPGVGERSAAAAKEMPISGRGSADVVIVDASGDITVVECKLPANPEIRSQGGAIAQQLVLVHPERCGHLVPACT